MVRKQEYFEAIKLKHKDVISCTPSTLFPQETDWTCSIACIRTILSGICKNIPEEEFFINKYNLTPKPYYSNDIKNLGILNEYNAIYGQDIKNNNIDNVLDYVENGYFVMLESMYNYAHWMVLLGYYPLENNIEKSKLLMFDPYYNEIRLINVDEFIGMWMDGNYAKNSIENDFIAIKK